MTTPLGKRLALMVEVEDEAVSGDIRKRFEEEWSQGQPVREDGESEKPDEEDSEKQEE
jgi:hypothetical protein